MDYGGQCVTMDGVTVMLKLCADNWGTVLTQVECFLHIRSTYIPSEVQSMAVLTSPLLPVSTPCMHI